MKEEKLKINTITPLEWWESANSPLGIPFYPARYHYPKFWHRNYVAEARRNYNTDEIEFLTQVNRGA